MWYAVGAAVIGAGASIYSSNRASKAQSQAVGDAAEVSAQATGDANALQKDMYDQTRADQTPWRDAGKQALNQLSAGTKPGGELIVAAPTQANFTLADFQKDPGRAFRITEGVKTLDRSASAKGQLLSGAALKGLTRFGQDEASQEYSKAFDRYNFNRNYSQNLFQTNQTNRFNRLASVAGVGQTANNSLQQAGATYAGASNNNTMTNASNQGNALIASGNANASSYSGVGNALSTAANNLGQAWTNKQDNTWINPDTGRAF